MALRGTYAAASRTNATSVSNAATVKLHFLPVNDGVDAVDDRYGVLRNTVFQSGRSVGENDRHDPDYPVRYEVTVPPRDTAMPTASLPRKRMRGCGGSA